MWFPMPMCCPGMCCWACAMMRPRRCWRPTMIIGPTWYCPARCGGYGWGGTNPWPGICHGSRAAAAAGTGTVGLGLGRPPSKSFSICSRFALAFCGEWKVKIGQGGSSKISACVYVCMCICTGALWSAAATPSSCMSARVLMPASSMACRSSSCERAR